MRPHNNSRLPSFALVGLLIAIALLAYSYWSVSWKNSNLSKELEQTFVDLKQERSKKVEMSKRLDAMDQKLKDLSSDLDKEKSQSTSHRKNYDSCQSQLSDINHSYEMIKSDFSQCQNKMAEESELATSARKEKETLQATVDQCKNDLEDEKRKLSDEKNAATLQCHANVDTLRLKILNLVAKYAGNDVIVKLTAEGIDTLGVTMNTQDNFNRPVNPYSKDQPNKDAYPVGSDARYSNNDKRPNPPPEPEYKLPENKWPESKPFVPREENAYKASPPPLPIDSYNPVLQKNNRDDNYVKNSDTDQNRNVPSAHDEPPRNAGHGGLPSDNSIDDRGINKMSQLDGAGYPAETKFVKSREDAAQYPPQPQVTLNPNSENDFRQPIGQSFPGKANEGFEVQGPIGGKDVDNNQGDNSVRDKNDDGNIVDKSALGQLKDNQKPDQPQDTDNKFFQGNLQNKNLLQPDQQLDTKRSALGERLDGNLKSSFNEQKEDFAKAPLPDQVIPPPSNNKDENADDDNTDEKLLKDKKDAILKPDAADMQDDNKEEAEDDNDKADDEDADQNGNKMDAADHKKANADKNDEDAYEDVGAKGKGQN